jgi:NAD(P)-dependent dehydrogenase (short-subunit alcohol dehydrogenase family)
LHPIKLVAQPEEIAELVLFFASPASDYITGQVLPGIYD